jgi:hypothetical protein
MAETFLTLVFSLGQLLTNNNNNNNNNFVALVCEGTILTKQPPLLGEVIANFCR